MVVRDHFPEHVCPWDHKHRDVAHVRSIGFFQNHDA